MQQGTRTTWLCGKLHKTRVEAVAFVNELWLGLPPSAWQRSPPSVAERYSTLLLRTVQFVNGLRPSNKWPVHQRIYPSYCILSHSCPVHQRAHRLPINCHVRALFVNGHRKATNCHVYVWDIVATRFLWQHGELSLVKQQQVCPPPLTSGYAGQAQSWPFVNVLRVLVARIIHAVCVCLLTCACVWPIWQVRTAIMIDFNVYWAALPIGGCDSLLAGCKCKTQEAWKDSSVHVHLQRHRIMTGVGVEEL